MSHSATRVETESTGEAPARIGPNALIQTVAALQERFAPSCVEEILKAAGEGNLLNEQPETMVPERRFADMVGALADKLGVGTGREVLHQSGRLTADYLLANRIPKQFQASLKFLPRRLAQWVLLTTIKQNAWTFIGSGEFTYHHALSRTPQIQVASCVHPASVSCGFYGGTFERLVQKLINSGAHMRWDVKGSGDESCCVYTFEYR